MNDNDMISRAYLCDLVACFPAGADGPADATERVEWAKGHILKAIKAAPSVTQPAPTLSDALAVAGIAALKAEHAALVRAMRAADGYLERGHKKMAHNITRYALRQINGDA